MANVLRSSVATLLSRLQASASEAIVYSRGALSINCNATMGRKLLRVNDGAGQTRIEVTDADFLIPASDLVLEGAVIEPERGDRIFLEAPDVDSLYEVLPYGDEPPFRWSDPYRTICRVHAKLIEQIPHQALVPGNLSLSPASGTATGSTAVTITGVNFAAGATVTFGGTAATSVVVVSNTTITCLTPAHANGAVDVVVTNPDGQHATLFAGYVYIGSNTDLWNAAGNLWNQAAFNWATITPPAAFTPAALPSLASWIKADGTLWQNSNLTTPATADGDRVGAWVPSGGTAGNWLQATAGKRPTLKLAIQNSLPVIRFGAEGGFLTLAAAIASVGDFSLFFVASRTNTGTGDELLFADNGSTQYLVDFFDAARANGNSFSQSSSNAWGPNTFCVYEVHRSGSTFSYSRDGVSIAAIGTSASTFTVGEISGRNGGNLPFVGDLGEVIFCTTYLPETGSPTSDRRNARNYLRTRWETP